MTELVDRLGVVGALDDGIGPIKRRDRGLSGGDLLVGMAVSQLEGESSLAGLDRSRVDAAGAWLAPVPFAPPRTAARLAERFGPAQLAGTGSAASEPSPPASSPAPADPRPFLDFQRGRPAVSDLDQDSRAAGPGRPGPGPARRAADPANPALSDLAVSPFALPLAGLDREVRVAFAGRISTEEQQDPRQSLIRQLDRAKSALPESWVIVAHFYDVESGRKELISAATGPTCPGSTSRSRATVASTICWPKRIIRAAGSMR